MGGGKCAMIWCRGGGEGEESDLKTAKSSLYVL
jgi:hypothetical protein